MKITKFPEVERVHELFDYKDGKLFWKAKTSKYDTRTKVGSEAGNLDPRDGSLQVRFDNKRYPLQYVIWAWHGNPRPNGYITFIDGNPQNVSIENLQDVPKGVIMAKAKTRKDSLTGARGVTKVFNGYQARLFFNGELHIFGTFPTVEEAEKVYRESVKNFIANYEE